MQACQPEFLHETMHIVYDISMHIIIATTQKQTYAHTVAATHNLKQKHKAKVS